MNGGSGMSGMSGMNGGSGMSGMSGMNGGSGMGGMSGMNGGSGMGGGMALPNGAAFDVMRFDIDTQATDPVTLYTTLPSGADINTRIAESASSKTRKFVMQMGMMCGGGMSNMGSGSNMSNGGTSSMPSSGMGGMGFCINGKSFDMNVVNETITTNGQPVTEVWEVSNMSPMAHPFHAHATQYQVLDRNGKAATGTDLGWKDTVLVEPGQTVRMIGRFEPTVNFNGTSINVNEGKYMYHCHILEHEDAGMMGIFEVN